MEMEANPGSGGGCGLRWRPTERKTPAAFDEIILENQEVRMKKMWFVLILIAFLTIASFTVAGEGTKILVFRDGTQIIVPEKAPDFNEFTNADLIGQKSFQNGNKIELVGIYTDDQTINVAVVLVYKKTCPKGQVVAFSVSYHGRAWEFYEDTDFMKTAVPSDKLIRVDQEPDVNKIINLLSITTT